MRLHAPTPRPITASSGLSERHSSKLLAAVIAASFFVLALVVMSAPAGQAGAQKSGENVVRSGSIAVSGATSVVRGRTADVTVTTSALSAALLNSYYVRVTSNAVVDNNSGCSNGGVWTINPTQQTETTTISVYGCSIGDGVITGELWFSGPDGFDSKVRSDDHDIEVTATAVTTPVSTPAPRVSITAGSSIIIEGTDATFTIGVRGDFTGSLDVSIDVTGGSSFIEGTPPNTVIIQSGSTSETLTIETERDELDEPDATITVYLEDGDDYDLVSGSSSASVTVRDDDLSRPGRPTGLRVTRSDSGPADGTVTVSWNRSSDASDYRVQRGTSRYSNYSLVDSRTQNRISVELEAPCGTTYYFRVAADGKENVAEGWGSYSSGVVAPTCPPGPTIDSITALANLGRGTVQVDWTSRYRSLGEKMQRGTERNGVISYVSAPFQGGEPTRAKQVHEGIYTAPCGQLQYYRVAYQIRPRENHSYSNRWSAYSSPRSAPLCTAPAPTRLRVTNETPYTKTLSWRAAPVANSYMIERSSNGTSGWFPADSGAGSISSNATSYTVTRLTCGKGYHFQIFAEGDGEAYKSGFGDASGSIEARVTDDSTCPVITIERPKDNNSRTIYRIFENTNATFIVNSDKAVDRALIIGISVTDEGNVVSGTKPTTFPFPANSTTATLTVETDDDTRTDGAGSITVTLLDTTTRNDYNLGSDTSTSLIIDDDDLPLPPAPGGVSIQREYGHGVPLVQFRHSSVPSARNYVVQQGTSSDPNHRSFTTLLPYRQTQPDGASRSLFTSDVYTASCDTTTYFRVAVEGDGETWRWARGEFTTPAATPPCHAPAPNDFAVDDSLTTDSTLTMSWTHEPGVTQYKIERWLSGNTYNNDVIEINHVAGTANVSYEITGLACGTTFRYAISAKGDGVDDTNQGLPWYPDLYGTRSGNARGTTDACRVVSISTPMPTATPAPAHPQSDHRIFEGNAATFILTADEEFGAETIINITVSTSKASIAGTTPTQVTFAADSDTHTLTLNTLDYTTEQGRGSITVAVATPHPTAIPSYTVSANSGTATLTVDDDDLDLPDAPENLSVTLVSETNTTQDVPVTISYSAVDGAASYQVERRLQGAADWGFVETSGNVTVTCASTYEFQVKTFGNGETKRAVQGAPSSTVTVTFDCPLAPAPSGLSVSSTEKYALTLRWSSVPDAAFYKLEREGANANEWVSAGVGADEITGVTHTVTGLQCGTSYSFQISANGDGYPYSTTFGEPSATLPVQETDDCPIVSVNIPSFIPTSSSPVRQYRIFEGGDAVFTLATTERFPLAVPVRIGVTHTGVGITDAILATITFPANSDTTTLQFATIDNNSDPDDVDNSDDGRKLITVSLEAGTGYRVSSSTGSSSIPVDDNDLDPAPAPQNITIASTQNYPTSVRIDWTRGTNISRYRVEKRLPQSSNPAEQRWTSAGSYTILGRTVGVDASTTCGLPHEYRVIPVGDGEVYLLDAGTASVTLSYTGGCPAANAPTGLMNTATTEYSVSLGWNSVTGAEFYKIERSADGQTGWAVVSAQDDTVAAPATKHTVTGLACGTGHYFRVSARGDGTPRLATYGTVSATLGPVTTDACPTVSIAPGTTPIVEGSDVTFTISLDPDVAVELPISITASQQGNFVATATPTPVPVPANSETYALTIATIDDTVGEPRGSYTVTLQANDDLYSIDPDASSATVTIDDDDLPPALPPADVTVVPVTTTPTFYRAEWTRANNVDRYEVEYRIPGETPWTSFGAYTIRVSVGVPNSLLCGKTYEFQVRAKGDGITTLARYGDWLNPPLSFTSHDCLAVPAPNNLAASNQGLMSIDFSWSPVTGAIEYKLEHRVKETNTWEEVLIDAPGVLPNAVTPTSATNPSTTLTSLACRTNYSIRVSARGNGRLYSSEFGATSTDLETSTERSYTACADRIPTFGSETISELRLTVDVAMTAVTLPEATGGDSPLTYSVSTDLPAGLMFDADDRQITGTPTVTSCGASYIYTVTDADATDADTDTISFNIAVLSGENASPTFNNATVADWTYSVTTNSTALQLPQAVGGFGPLRYSIHPTGNTSGSLPAGLTFNANRLLIYGVPTSTAAAVEYTFTVRNRADCASTDSDSITFNISIPDGPSLPATPTSVTGLSATADNDAGTITISWSANNYPGYQIRQYVSPRLLYPGLPRENYVITCGGKLATICPADATSAVISGYSATGWYYILVSGHNGRSVSTASAYVSTGSVRLTAVSDPEPTFGTATVADMVLIEDTDMTPVTLPIANGGNGRLSYTITPALPTGLSFNPLTRAISGEPTATSTATTYTYTVTDSDATNSDTDTITFRIEVVDTEISVTGLRSPVYEGESIAFTVTVTDVPSLGSYDLVVTAYGAAGTTSSSTNSDIGFNSVCSDVAESDDVTSGAATQSESHTLHVCDSEYNGGIVTMVLVDDDDNVLVGDWFYVEARPTTVRIEADNDFLVTGGTEDDRTVKLTATVEGPSGVNLQWQEWSGTAWTNLGTPTPSNPATLDVDASSEEGDGETEYLRGTKKYQVAVSHSTESPVDSEPFYVTWDEMEILSDLSLALSVAVEADSGYTSAQTSLINCMDIPTITTFNGLLSQYSGATKLKMDNTCRSQSDAMFSRVESLSQSHLSTLKTGNAEYAAWLETPRGVNYEALAGNSKRLRLHAIFMSSDTTTQPGSLAAPYYGGVRGIRSPAPDPPLAPFLTQETGLGCLPSGVSGRHLTLANKIRVLNCLVFATPHDFWVVGADGARPADQLMEEDIPNDQKRWNWLGFEEWDCTKSPDGPLPSCLKHDVAFDSLKKFAGPTAGKSNGDELDAAWNPRNKALADAKFFADIQKYGCQDYGWYADTTVCPPNNIYGHKTNRDLAQFYWHAVAIGVTIFPTHRGWPVTGFDLIDIRDNYEFAVCGDPSARTPMPPTPQLYVLAPTKRPYNNGTFVADLGKADGCVSDITVESYTVVWRVHPRVGQHFDVPVTGYDFDSSELKRSTLELNWVQRLNTIAGIELVEIVRIELKPNARAYGGTSYTYELSDVTVYES